MRKQSNWLTAPVKWTWGKAKDGYNSVAKDVKDTYNGFRPQHLLPDWAAKHVLPKDVYTPGNVTNGKELKTHNTLSEHAYKGIPTWSRFFNHAVTPKFDVVPGHPDSRMYDNNRAVVEFQPRSQDPVENLVQTFIGPNATTQQRDAMRQRIESAKQARIKAGVPENMAPYFMNYDTTEVKQYYTPDGTPVSMPSLSVWSRPEAFPVGTPIIRNAKYWIADPENIKKREGRAYADKFINPGFGYLDEGGMLSPKDTPYTVSHEGFLPYIGHYGTQSWGRKVHTFWPYVQDKDSPTAGLPYHSMSVAAVGGDPGHFGSSYFSRSPKAYGPETYSKAFKDIINENGGSYFLSPREFAADASNIKNIAAARGNTSLNRFDPDNPGEFLRQLHHTLQPRTPNTTSDKLMNELQLYSGWHIYQLINKYNNLHYRRTQGKEPLSQADEAEYQHLRKVLPSIWDQASNKTRRRPNPYMHSETAVG